MATGVSSRRAASARVLGDVAVLLDDGSELAVSPLQQRILIRLAADQPRTVSMEELVRALWPDGEPASARQAVQNQISRLRHAAGDEVIATADGGYRLGVPTDAEELIDAAVDGERLLSSGDPQAAFDRIDAAIGDGLVPTDGFGRQQLGFRSTIDAAVQAAQTTRLEAALELGRRTWALVEAERLVAAAPLDERRAALHARALVLAGRRGDALAAIGRVRQSLRIDLGIEPGPDLVTVEREILRGAGGDSRSSDDVGAPLFVGREDALRQVLQTVAQRRTVRVTGEHGSGVSRILFEARTRLIGLGVRAILVRAEENPHSATSLVEELLAELDVAVGPMQSALTAFESVVASINDATPTVFLIDDVQFLGPSAWQAIRAVAEAEYGGVILGGHGAVVALDGEVEVHLGPLDAAAVSVMARQWGVTHADTLGQIATASGGNPLAVGLISRSAGEPPTGQQAGQQSDVWTTRLPEPAAVPGGLLPDFADFIEQLIGDRDAERRHDLQLAAVAGDGYPVAAFAHLNWPHIPEPPADLVEIDTAGLMRFKHGVVQAHAYRTVPRGVALDMHYSLGQAARAVSAPAGIVARHLLAAAELDPAGAIDAARGAAAAAGRLGAHADAADWLRRAQEIAARGGSDHTASASGADPAAHAPGATESHSEDHSAGTHDAELTRLALDIEYGDALRLMGDPDHLPQLLSATRRALDYGNDQLIAAAGFALLQLGGSSAAGALDDELTALVGDVINAIEDPELRAPVQAAASLAWSMTGNAARARGLFDAAEAAATSPAARMAVLPFAYLALGMPADLPRRAALAEELVALAEAAHEPTALWEGMHLQFTVRIQQGDVNGAEACLARMEALIERIGDVGRRWSTLYCAASIAHLRGDPELAEQLAERAHLTFAPVSAARAAAAYYAQLLPLRLEQGRLGELRPIVEAMVREQPGVTAWHAAAALVLADAWARSGADSAAGRSGADSAADPGAVGPEVGHGVGHGVGRDEADFEAACHHAALALELAQPDFTWLAAHVIGGRASALLGEPALARQYAERLEPWADLVCWQGTCSYGPVRGTLDLLAPVAAR